MWPHNWSLTNTTHPHTNFSGTSRQPRPAYFCLGSFAFLNSKKEAKQILNLARLLNIVRKCLESWSTKIHSLDHSWLILLWATWFLTLYFDQEFCSYHSKFIPITGMLFLKQEFCFFLVDFFTVTRNIFLCHETHFFLGGLPEGSPTSIGGFLNKLIN